MAGGQGWVFKSVQYPSEVYQKTKGGDWYMRKAIEVTIRKQVGALEIDLNGGERGQSSSLISFAVGPKARRSMALPVEQKFVCKDDRFEEIQSMAAYVMRTQTWVWIDNKETRLTFTEG